MLPSQVTIDGVQGMIQPSGLVKFGDDNRANVKFYKKPVLSREKSIELGRAFYEEVEYVFIQHPGEKDFSDAPLSEKPEAMHRWPRQWAQYQQNQAQVPAGSPVEHLFPTEPAIAANLHSVGVHTIEQLSVLTAEGISQVGMGAMQWHMKAKEWLASANKGVGHHQFQKAMDDKDNQIEVLKNQLSLLQRSIDMLMAEKQGVPPAMIPNTPGSIAQQSIPVQPAALPPSAFGPTPDPFAPAAPDNVTQMEQPKARGWPKGKPRKPKAA